MINDINELAKDSLVRNYGAGSTVFYQGEVPRSVAIVKSGFLKSFNISADGSEQIVNFHVPGEILPLGWLFGKTSVSIYFIESMTDATLLLLPRERVLDYITGKPAVMEKVLDSAVSSYTASLMHICALEQTKATQKILHTLYYLARKFGTPRGQSTYISIDLTHQDIASLVGLTRETTATELNRLKKDKVLNYKNKKYQINTSAIIEAMGEESFLSVKL